MRHGVDLTRCTVKLARAFLTMWTFKLMAFETREKDALSKFVDRKQL